MYLEVNVVSKPTVNLSDAEDNIYILVNKISKILKQKGLYQQAQEMSRRVFNSESYEEAIKIISKYVKIK